MPFNKDDEVSYLVPISFPELMPADLKNRCMREVASYVISEIIDYCDAQTSPVTGRPFTELDPNYAEYKKSLGRPGVPNLTLFGDMLSSLDYKITEFGVKVGIFGDQAPKAYNHNTGDTIPIRPFIPRENGSFVSDIQSTVNEIVEEYVDEFLAQEEIGAAFDIQIRTPTITRPVTPETIDVGALLDFEGFL